MRIFRTAAAFLTLVALATPAAAAEAPTLATVLERAGAYVADFQRQLSGIVAEERYVQDWRPAGARGPARRAGWRLSPLQVSLGDLVRREAVRHGDSNARAEGSSRAGPFLDRAGHRASADERAEGREP